MRIEKVRNGFHHRHDGVFARLGKELLAADTNPEIGLVQDGVEIVFEVLRLAFFDNQQRALAAAELDDFLIDERIGDVQHVEWNPDAVERVRKPLRFQHPVPRC